MTESADGTKKYLFAAGNGAVRGGGVDPRRAAGHSLPFGPGRLQDGLPVLHDGEAGVPGPPDGRRDPQPVPEPAGTGACDQHRLHGDGRASGQSRERTRQPGNPLLRLRVRLEPHADHGLHDRPCAGNAHIPGHDPLPPRREPAHAFRGGAEAPDAHRERPSALRSPGGAPGPDGARPAARLLRVHRVRRPERHSPPRAGARAHPGRHPMSGQPHPVPRHPRHAALARPPGMRWSDSSHCCGSGEC